MGKILIKHVVLNEAVKDILIEGNRITRIGSHIDSGSEIIVDGKNRTAIPGFINMHTHAAMVLMRGVFEDTPLFEWLQNIWRVEVNLDDENVYWATRLACLEMIKTGTLCYNDQYWRIDRSARAVEEMGIRAFLSYVFLDLGDPAKVELQRRECEETYERALKWGERENFTISIHGIYTVCEENILWAAEFARKHDLLIHIHLSETEKENADCIREHGMSPTRYLDSLGVLDHHVIAAHGIWLDEDDIRILGERKVNIVHNINSNLKLASGYRFKYEELKAAGANVTLGTDGAASSNNLDMLEAIKTTSLLQKAWRGDPAAFPLEEGFALATKNGAKALRLNSGRIEEGALADLLLVNTRSSFFIPDKNFLGNLIYAANSSCIDTAICNGRIVMQDRHVDGEEEILDQVNRLAGKLYK